MRSNKTCLCVTFACVLTTILHAQFHQVYHGPDTSNDIRGISFYNKKEGYVAFRTFIGFTADSGHTFFKNYILYGNVNYNGYSVNLTFGFNPHGVKAFSKDTLIVFGDYGFEPSILYSVDAGLSWLLVYHRGLRFDAYYLLKGITDMEFPGNSVTGFAVDGEEVLKSTTRGRTWALVRSDYNQRLSKLSFVNAQTGYVVGPGRFLKTSDGGTSWQILSPLASMTDVDFISSQTGYISNEYGFFYKTTDGGSTFQQMNEETTSLHADDIHFINDSTGYAAVHPYIVLKTSNSGKIWEPLPGSNSYQFLGFGYNTLFLYDNSTIWAGGDREYLSLTTNGGGRPRPVAAFTANTTSVCTDNTVRLQNLSSTNYTYKWYRNGVLLSTSYNTSYTAQTGTDAIRLIVNNGFESDTADQTIYSGVSSSFSITSIQRDTVICSTGAAIVDVFNSDPEAQYTIGSDITGYQPPVNGNGGTLTLAIGVISGISSININIIGWKSTSCGEQRDTSTHTFGVIDSWMSVEAIATGTFCPQLTAPIQIIDSKVGWTYWADWSIPPFPGNGDTLTIQATAGAATYVQDGDNDLDKIYHYDIFARNIVYGCYTSFSRASVSIEGRLSASKFDMYGYDYFVGDTLQFGNQSRQAETYKWVFDSTANQNNATAENPKNIVYKMPGQKSVKLYAISHEGCVDSATWTIEIYQKTSAPESFTLCKIGATNASDTIAGPSKYMNRDVYQDSSGNIYAVGGHIRFDGLYFYPAGNEGWYATKFDKNGKLLWRLEQSSPSTFSYSYHIIAEQIVADKKGNAFIYGHALGISTIKDSFNTYPIPAPCSFLVKVDTKGKILWVKSFYSTDTYHYFGGTLLKGKNDDLYITTEAQKDADFQINDTVLQHPLTGLIIHMDVDGNVLDQKSFPAQFTYLQLHNPYMPDNYDRFPHSTYDAEGRIVIYDNLDPAEISGNQIDDGVINFDLNAIQSALLKYDTVTKRIISVKPIYYLDKKNNKRGLQPMSFAVDSLGGYYSGWETYIDILPNSQTTVVDKPKGVLTAFDSSGNQRWSKQTEGLDPWNMLVAKDKLFILGQDYIAEGYSTDQQYHYQTVSPVLPQTKKTIAVFNEASYNAAGTKGNGSLDFVLTRFSLTDGTFEAANVFGSDKEQECGALKKGAGDQLIFAGTGDYTLRATFDTEDTLGMQFIMKAAIKDNCELGNVLPLSLISFNAVKKGGDALLTWSTSNELNTSYFNVQRSTDGIHFTKIGAVPAAHGSIINNYNYSDNITKITSAAVYYRLQIVDNDNLTTYSRIAKIDLSASPVFAINPNPASGSFTLITGNINGNNAFIVLTNALGVPVLRENVYSDHQTINISSLARGIYFVSLVNGDSLQRKKLVVQ